MPRTLRAGPLSLLYENGDIRAIQLGETEVLRRIYAAVRDRNWGTVPPHIENETVFDGGDHFRVAFLARHRQDENKIAFDWQGEIAGERDGTITFAFDGEAKTSFERNRIGFCVLHPRVLAGAPVTIGHPDGSEEETNFPTHIAPHQPFCDVAAMTHKIAPTVRAKVVFSGDVFETEDQRNWLDASFKTYCTPLALPSPFRIEAGTRVRQNIRLELLGQLAQSAPPTADDAAVSLHLSEPRGALPPIGLMIAQEEKPLSPREIERLKALGLAHLRVDLSLQEADFDDTLRRAADEARALGCPLQIALFSGDAPDFEPLARALKAMEPEVASFLIFADKVRSASREVFAEARAKLRQRHPAARFGAGTNDNFTEFNRNPPPLDDADFVVCAANPQVHAFDNDSIMETPATLPDIVSSARVLAPSKGVAISPLTLKARPNAVATKAARDLSPHEFPADADARQTTLFGAAWTLSVLASLTACDLESLTLYGTTGWRGVMESEYSHRGALPDDSYSDAVFPLWHVLAEVASTRDAAAFPLISSDARRVTGLAFSDGFHTRILLANVSRSSQQVALAWPLPSAEVRIINEENLDFARRAEEAFGAQSESKITTENGVLRFRLGAYAIARIKEEGEE